MNIIESAAKIIRIWELSFKIVQRNKKKSENPMSNFCLIFLWYGKVFFLQRWL